MSVADPWSTALLFTLLLVHHVPKSPCRPSVRSVRSFALAVPSLRLVV